MPKLKMTGFAENRKRRGKGSWQSCQGTHFSGSHPCRPKLRTTSRSVWSARSLLPAFERSTGIKSAGKPGRTPYASRVTCPVAYFEITETRYLVSYNFQTF